MPETLLQQKLFPYDGAQNTTKNALLISPKDIVTSDNIVYTTYSTKKKRPGISLPFARPAGNSHILGGIDFHRLGVQRVVYYDGVKLRALDPATGIVDDITGTHAIPVDEAVTFTIFNGLLMIFFYGGNTPPKRWTQSGSIVDLGATAPNAAFGRVFLNSLWVPDPTVPGRVLKSRTGDPTLFTGGDSLAIDLDVNDGDPDGITAIFPPFYGSLYVAKRFSLYRITPQYNGATLFYAPAKISDGVGCISHNAAVAAEGNIIFPSDRGLHTFDSTDKVSGIEPNFLSGVIQPTWVSETNFDRGRFMQATYDPTLNSYLFIHPSRTRLYPNNLWGYSVEVGKWYRWQNFNHTSVFKYVDTVNSRVRTMVGSRDGDMGYLDEDVKTDYGVPYNCSMQSGIISPAGAPDEQFGFNYIAPIFVPQTQGKFKITYKIDGHTIETLEFDMTDTSLGDDLGEDFIPGQSVLGGVPRIKIDKRSIVGYGMVYELIISHEAIADEDFELLGILMDVDRTTKIVGQTIA